MNTKSPTLRGLAYLLSLLIAFPAEIYAAPQGGQRAGEVARVIPAVSIARASKTIPASTKTVVDWQDQVNTQAGARARISLDDGSVLNVGSDSSVKIAKHDAAAQQTEIELTYGKLRSQAQKIAKPNGKFEVRTAAGVAGVVGTDFYLAYETNNNTMTVIVYEGLVKVCNLSGDCVIVKAGQMTSVRSGNNSPPLPPTQATLDILVAGTKDTDVGGMLNGPPLGPHLGAWWTIGLVLGVPAVALPIALTRSGKKPAPTNGCPPGYPIC